MISAGDLSEEQVAEVKSWAEDGAQLPEIQKMLEEKMGLRATYMDTRFLVLDLGIELKKDEEEVEEEEPEQAGDEAEAAPESAGDEPEAAPVGGGLSVVMDEVAQPGAAVSGRVVFSDGVKGVWMIDQMGRPGLETEKEGYEPSEADLVAFEQELRRLLQGG